MEKIILKKEETIAEMKEKLRSVSKKFKGLDAKKYSGIIKGMKIRQNTKKG